MTVEMERIISGIIENSLIGGAFIYMLYTFLTKFSSTLEGIANTLMKIDSRLNTMEVRINRLEERRQVQEEIEFEDRRRERRDNNG